MTQLGADKIAKIFGTPEEMHARHLHMEKDVLFLWNHMPQWREKYLDKWIAVYDQEVIAVADDLQAIEKEVGKVSVPRGEVLLQPIRSSFANIVPSVFRAIE